MAPTAPSYPVARRDKNHINLVHGMKIVDPYYWLENSELDETRTFINEQNRFSNTYLQSFPFREKIQNDLKELYDYPLSSCCRKYGHYYYIYEKKNLQNHRVLYQKNKIDAEPVVFFDTNALSTDGSISLSYYKFSQSGKIFAYALSKNGSDWREIRFRNVETGEEFEETLEKIKLSNIAWAKDEGIFYSGFLNQEGKIDGTLTDENKNMKLYFHKVGTPQSHDKIVLQFPNEPYWRMLCQTSDDGNYLIAFVRKNCENKFMVLYLDILDYLSSGLTEDVEFIPIIPEFKDDYTVITTSGSYVYFVTTKDAPNGRLVKINLKNCNEFNWEVVVKEDSQRVLDSAFINSAYNILLCSYIEDAHHILKIRYLYDYDGPLHKIPIGSEGEFGTINISCSINLEKNPGVAIVFETFTHVKRVYEIYFKDLGEKTPESSSSHAQKKFQNIENFLRLTYEDSQGGLNNEEFTVEQKFYLSGEEDDIIVPIYIAYKKSLFPEGKISPAPCLLCGYGGFSSRMLPFYSELHIAFMRHYNGIFAFANIRGGGEYGTKWYDEGRQREKTNSFEDFEYAAKYLIESNYTSPDKLVIKGFSNGGLLVGACINRNPELFKAAIGISGIYDLAQFHKFTLGRGWTSEYGYPENKDDFYQIMTYSPLHNVRTPEKNKKFPAVFLMTGDHDDRVIPAHSYKFAAELQHKIAINSNLRNPILVRVSSNCGHGNGKSTSKLIEDDVEMLCFIGKVLDLNYA